MKAIFLCESENNVRRVYSEDALKKIRFLTETGDRVFRKGEVMASPEAFADAEIIFSTWGMPSFSEEEIVRCFPSLKAVFYAAGSVQGFAAPFLKKGILVFSAWAANGVPVAEYTVSQIVLANKHFFRSCSKMSGGDVAGARKIFSACRGNFENNVGLIGCGMIGSMVAERLKEYRMHVYAYDPFLSAEKAERLGVTRLDTLEELFSTCSVVSNHLANNAQTRGILHYGLFSKMPPFATFLNTGRGAQVVEADLKRILSEREDLCCVLDVTQPEPPEEGSDFYRLPNCFLTPHIAGSAGREVERMSEYMAEELENYLDGKSVRYSVSLEMLATMA